MSVNRTDYIVYGWKLPFDIKGSKDQIIDLWDDKFLPMIEGRKGEKFSLIRDGMCGGYTVFGKVLYHNGDDYEGWGFEQIKIKEFYPHELKIAFKDLFDPHEALIKSMGDPTLFIFSHFS